MNRTFQRIQLFRILVCLMAFIITENAMGFGKNKVTYQSFSWITHETDHFQFYYYPEEKDLVPEVIRYFETAYSRISKELGSDITGKTPVILYKTHQDFKQTNIISEFIPEGVGGFSEPIKRRIVIPLEGPKKQLESLINHELVHTFQFEILFQNRFNRIAPVPAWIMEGLAEHLAADWDSTGRMVLRDAVINNAIPSLKQMESFDYLPSQYLGYKLGQSAMDYLRTTHGIDKLHRLLWEIRKTLKSQNYFEKAIKEVYNMTLNELSDLWSEDLRRRVIEIERRREGVTAFGERISDQPGYNRRLSPVYSPGGELISYIESGSDGYHIFRGTINREKKNRIIDNLTENLDYYRYRQIIMDGRPLSGNPWDDLLVYLSKREDKIYAQIIDPAAGGLIRSITIPEDQATSPALSPDANHIAYAAYLNGQSDIYILDLTTGISRNITQDSYVDETPYFSPDGQWLIYSTEREGQFDLYRVSTGSRMMEPVILSPGNETTPCWSPDGTRIAYISDRIDGINDPYIMELSSGQIQRIAAPSTGMFTPSWSPNNQNITLSYYYNLSEQIIVIPATRQVAIPEVAKDATPLGVDGETQYNMLPEAVPLGVMPESTAQLKDDPVKFRLIPDMALGMISYGSDNEFSMEGGVLMSDILGDHQFSLIGIRRGNRNGLMGTYLYLKNRIDYGVSLMNDSDYYYVFNPSRSLYEKVQWDYYSGILHSEYPFSTRYRAEFDIGFFQRNYDSDIPYYNDYDEKQLYIEPAFEGDSVIYRPLTTTWEAYSGHRFRFSTRIPIEVTDTFQNYWNSYFDYRLYLPLSKRSLIAIREWGIVSSGNETEYFGTGGFGTVRGYDYNTLVGTYLAISNVELRFPLIDRIQFPGNAGFSGFRGKFFMDAAAIWSKGQDPEWKFDDPDTSRELEGNLYGAAGFGINFWFIGVEWHFEWARRTDFSSFSGDWVYQWSIRRSY